MREDEGAAAEARRGRLAAKRTPPRRALSGRRPTMIDVANEARVSQTTVSLVLNHADGARLSAETRERVMKAAVRLGYQPVRRGGAPGSAAAPTDPISACLRLMSIASPPLKRRVFMRLRTAF